MSFTFESHWIKEKCQRMYCIILLLLYFIYNTDIKLYVINEIFCNLSFYFENDFQMIVLRIIKTLIQIKCKHKIFSKSNDVLINDWVLHLKTNELMKNTREGTVWQPEVNDVTLC